MRTWLTFAWALACKFSKFGIAGAIASLLTAASTFAQSTEGAAGEANLKLPDLSSVQFLGIDGHRLLLYGILFCVFGLIFGLVIYSRLKNLPVHRSMRDISELIYETCKTYLITQGKFLIVLWLFIAVVIVLYFGVLLKFEALRVIDPVKAVIEVTNYIYQTSQFAQTTLRSVLGEVDLDQVLSHRDQLSQRIQTIIDGHTAPFGVKVVSVEVKQVDMPESMLRAMAKQAEAERERRAKIIHAEGEFNAAAKLVDAAALMATQPMTLQLRYLQTLTEIGVEKNTTIVFPLPMELINLFNRTVGAAAMAPPAAPPTTVIEEPKG